MQTIFAILFEVQSSYRSLITDSFNMFRGIAMSSTLIKSWRMEQHACAFDVKNIITFTFEQLLEIFWMFINFIAFLFVLLFMWIFCTWFEPSNNIYFMWNFFICSHQILSFDANFGVMPKKWSEKSLGKLLQAEMDNFLTAITTQRKENG